MNKVMLIGRLVKDPNINRGNSTIARYTLAVNRKFKQDGQPTADFISCVCFGKSAEFVEKYLKKGTKIFVIGRIQTGQYTNKYGQTVYTTDVVAEEHGFVESRSASSQGSGTVTSNTSSDKADGFMTIPDGKEEELPFL